ncbi:MAG: DUF1538 domain-containing protein [Lachnospiraceae bacterium]|nr:DUF1538 domain-containing protein [Lachnospiraceae bacterium]
MIHLNPKLKEKFAEAMKAVLPIVAIVLVLCLTIAPVSPSILLCFLVGAVMVIIGMMFFTLGAEMAMSPMGEKVGSYLTKSKKLWLIAGVAFILGVIVTIAEPDLQVLASQVPSVPNMTLILAVSLGVGLFLVVALLRILLGIPLRPLLIFCYGLVFVLVCFVPEEFRSIAFDAGGVTTGPMTVPFIMALGVGIASIRSDSSASDDSFGLVALCSVGPVIAVMILGIIYSPESSDYALSAIPEIGDSVELTKLFLEEIPEYLREIAMSMLPVVLFFGVFEVLALRITGRTLTKILVGLVYTYVGLVLFLTGANVGFMPAGSYLGQVIAGQSYRWLLIPLGALIGYFIVKAEPAVYVLNHQVEEITNGAISAESMGRSLSAGVAVSTAIAMLRALTGIPILYFLIPGYAVAIILSFIVPNIFTAVAFDSGGVASGPMTATFLLSLSQGACYAVGGDLVSDAFGVVAMVAMTPLITIQIQGLVYKIKLGRGKAGESVVYDGLEAYAEDAIIEL